MQLSTLNTDQAQEQKAQDEGSREESLQRAQAVAALSQKKPCISRLA